MKALSIKPPWIELIVDGRKTIETRTWRTSYRGRIVLCSSKSVDGLAWREFGYPELLPRGHALAIAELIDCRTMTPFDEKAACCKYHPALSAWVFSDIEVIEPFPVRGRLGLFDVDLVKAAYRYGLD